MRAYKVVKAVTWQGKRTLMSATEDERSLANNSPFARIYREGPKIYPLHTPWKLKGLFVFQKLAQARAFAKEMGRPTFSDLEIWSVEVDELREIVLTTVSSGFPCGTRLAGYVKLIKKIK